MKKILAITAFAVAISLPVAFGSGRFEIRTRPVPVQPTYQQQRDQQWQISQRNMERQRLERQRQDQWQRAAWQRDMHQRNIRHQRGVTFEFWLRGHGRDYDNRRWENNGRYSD